MLARIAGRLIDLIPGGKLTVGALIAAAIVAGLAWSHNAAYQAGARHTQLELDARATQEANDRIAELERRIADGAVREAAARQRATHLANQLKELEDALPPARPGFEFSDHEYRVLSARRDAINAALQNGITQLPPALRPPAPAEPRPHPERQPDAGLGQGLRPAAPELRHPQREPDQ